VGVKHEHFEQLVSDMVAEDQLSVAPPVSISLGNVMPENRHLEWLFEPAPLDDISECKPMVHAVETYGAPFMRANITLPALREDLRLQSGATGEVEFAQAQGGGTCRGKEDHR
jgi:hypothetical protein